MTMEEKKKTVLKELYKYKFNGSYYEIADLLANYAPVEFNEAFSIGKSLGNQGFIEFIGSKQGASAEITAEDVDL